MFLKHTLLLVLCLVVHSMAVAQPAFMGDFQDRLITQQDQLEKIAAGQKVSPKISLVLQYLSNEQKALLKNNYQKLNKKLIREKLHSFGLSVLQKERLLKLSRGKVNFKEIYSYEFAQELLDEVIKQKLQRYSVQKAGMPPPVVVADPMLKDEYWINKLQVPEAWDIATGKGVTIVDCDSGFYINEPELDPQLLLSQSKDLADKDTPTVIDDGNYTYHGTAVASIMVGLKNDLSTNGIAYDAKLVPLQNYNYDNQDDIDKEEATAQCILHAIQIPEVKIILLENQTSEGSSETYSGSREAVKLALQAGIHIVSAAGNSSVELTHEVQEDTGSIIVGALDKDASMASFSNFSESRITVSAFGVELNTLYGPDGAFGSFGGTSGAAPQVAATLAMMLERNPDLSPAQARDIFIKTRVQSELNKQVGGLLNTLSAVKEAVVTPVLADQVEAFKEFRKKTIEILKNP